MSEREDDVTITCDGAQVPLVPFVAQLFASTVIAMVRTLKGAEKAKDITIRVKVKSEK